MTLTMPPSRMNTLSITTSGSSIGSARTIAQPPRGSAARPAALPRLVRMARAATATAVKVAASSSSGTRAPYRPVSSPPIIGAAMPATVLVACERPIAAGSRSMPTMPGSRACQVAEFTAWPVPSAATSASITGWLGSQASARQHASCPLPETSSRRRLSNRSTSAPTSGASSTRGSTPASSSATTGQAPLPWPWVRSSSATSATSSPSSETARASTAIRRSRIRHSEPEDRNVKDTLRS